MRFSCLISEPPFRLAAKAAVKALSRDVRRRAHWDVALRPQYLAGLLAAADQAAREGRSRMAAFEFGVANGAGLLVMADVAAAVTRATGVAIDVYGFDTGTGLPPLKAGYKDFPDHWQTGDYPMDAAALRARLPSHARLVLGEVADTLPAFAAEAHAPVGFVAIDVDLYSSTMDCLCLLTLARDNMLIHTPMYFDDIEYFFMHRFGGELAAIEDFNSSHDDLKIDAWRGLPKGRPFPDAFWLQKMYIAHNLAAAEAHSVARAAFTL